MERIPGHLWREGCFLSTDTQRILFSPILPNVLGALKERLKVRGITQTTLRPLYVLATGQALAGSENTLFLGKKQGVRYLSIFLVLFVHNFMNYFMKKE
jgi:hypothetical protein